MNKIKIMNLPILFLLVIMLTSFYLFYPSLSNVFIDAWLNSHSYSHGFLLLLVSVYLISSKPNSINESKGSFGFILLLLLCVFIDIVATILKIDVIMRFLLPIYIITTIGAVFGYNNLKRFIIPLTLLIFTVPSWSIISPIFQAIAAIAVANISQFIGIPTFIDGNYITIPNGTFQIAEGCSGVRYILVAISIALINCELSNYKIKHIIITTTFIFILAVLANWVRIEVIVIYAHIYGMGHPIVADHNTLGWVVFAVFMVIYFVTISYIAIQSKPFSFSSTPQLNAKQKLKGVLAIIILSLGSLFTSSFYQSDNKESLAINNDKQKNLFPFYSFSHFTSKNIFIDQQADYKHITHELTFNLQDKFSDMTHYENKPLSYHVQVIKELYLKNNLKPFKSPELNNIKTYQVKLNNKLYFYSYWYYIDHKIISSLTKVKLYSISALVHGDYNNKAFFISTPCNQQCSNSNAHIKYLSTIVEKNNDET